MSSFNHFVQKVYYSVLNSCCQEGILYSLPCHILKVNVILLYFSCLTFYFFLVTYLPVNFLWLLFKFSSTVFSFDSSKAKLNKQLFPYIWKERFEVRISWATLTSSHPKNVLKERFPGKCSIKEKGAFYSRWLLFQGLSLLTRHCRMPGSRLL